MTANELQAQISMKQQELSRMLKDVNKLKAQIENLKVRKAKNERTIFVSEHCLDRFIERVCIMPKGAIKALMKDKMLVELVATKGDGRYIMPNYPRCTVVVIDNTIVTCYLNNTIEFQFERLKRYMGYFVNCKAEQYKNGRNLTIKTFESFDLRINPKPNVIGA